MGFSHSYSHAGWWFPLRQNFHKRNPYLYGGVMLPPLQLFKNGFRPFPFSTLISPTMNILDRVVTVPPSLSKNPTERSWGHWTTSRSLYLCSIPPSFWVFSIDPNEVPQTASGFVSDLAPTCSCLASNTDASQCSHITRVATCDYVQGKHRG